MISYDDGEDVVVHGWLGSEAPSSSRAEAMADGGFDFEEPYLGYRNGRLECLLDYSESRAEPERTCAPMT